MQIMRTDLLSGIIITEEHDVNIYNNLLTCLLADLHCIVLRNVPLRYVTLRYGTLHLYMYNVQVNKCLF